MDKAAEPQRNTKRLDELTKQITQLKGRLSNEGYIAKAPPKLVQQTKDQLADAEAELAKLSDSSLPPGEGWVRIDGETDRSAKSGSTRGPHPASPGGGSEVLVSRTASSDFINSRRNIVAYDTGR